MITITEEQTVALRKLREDPRDSHARRELNSFYWEKLDEIVFASIEMSEKNGIDLTKYREFIDFGLVSKELFQSSEELNSVLKQTESGENRGLIYYFSEWIEKQYEEALNFNKKEEIQRKIALKRGEIKNEKQKVFSLQSERLANYERGIKPVMKKAGTLNRSALSEELKKMKSMASRHDNMFLKVNRIKKQLSEGLYLNVERKRELVNMETELADLRNKLEKLSSQIGTGDEFSKIRNVSKTIEEIIGEMILAQSEIVRMQRALENIDNETSSLSPEEINSRIGEVTGYNRELSQLAAKRARTTPFPCISSRSNFICKKKIESILKKIEEFDPKLFNNERALYMGMPDILIVPGTGNGIYDFKYNTLFIPLLPIGSPEESVFNAVVEYKLDVDEDKQMLNSYNKLDDYRGIRSLLTLKEKFRKDYTVWMTQEVNGYRVFPKEVRVWFEREVAPSKNEIVRPKKYHPLLMTEQEYNKLHEALEEKEKSGEADSEDHFALGTIYEYREKPVLAEECFKKAYEANPWNLNALFNFAIMKLKNHKKSEASELFNEYVKKNSRSWWASVCREHVTNSRG
ncbi:MAG: hypothetical protein ACLFQK_08250 [Fibrobacterota bacterium]